MTRLPCGCVINCLVHVKPIEAPQKVSQFDVRVDLNWCDDHKRAKDAIRLLRRLQATEELSQENADAIKELLK